MKNTISTITKGFLPMYRQEDIQTMVGLITPLIIRVDSYKGEHWWAMNQDVDYSHLYIEARSGDKVVQSAGIRALANILSMRITAPMVDFAEKFVSQHSFGHAKFNRDGWDRIVNEMNGRLPIELKALPEGTVAKPGTPMVVLRNTHPDFEWVVGYFGDMMLRTWKAMSVAGRCFRMKQILKRMADDTVDEEVIPMWLPYSLHDFGSRSVGTSEEASYSGMAAMQNIAGSDNWEATYYTMNTYGIPLDQMPSSSVFALEHNVLLTHGKAKELQVLRGLAREMLVNGRSGSLLIDTWDIDAVVDYFVSIKDELAQWWADGGKTGKVVLRPDSGDPIETPLEVLSKIFEGIGFTLNRKGFKVAPPFIGVIQGDEVSETMLCQMHVRLLDLKISASNLVFGCGGELIGNHKRDDSSWAAKITNNTFSDGSDVPCSKSPKYGKGKTTKEGYFRIVQTDDGFVTESSDTFEDSGELVPFFLNGDVVDTTTWEEVKARAASFL